MMPPRPSGTGILPLRIETPRRDVCTIILLLLSALFAMAAMDPPSQPITLSPEQAAKEGRALVDEMLSQQPEANAVTGVMAIRKDGSTKSYTEISIRFQTIVTSTNFVSLYQATRSNQVENISIVHAHGKTNIYYSGRNQFIVAGSAKNPAGSPTNLSGDAVFAPFAGSDFSIADLGLEFLHWPDQKLLQKDMKRSRSCLVLESTNPHPELGGCSKVKSWVDNESHGILYAEAYDRRGKELKEFVPQGVSKGADGQWQLEGMQISNVQTKSTTTVKFNLDK
jgi:hypothetical protein